jgi:hypothetical protein
MKQTTMGSLTGSFRKKKSFNIMNALAENMKKKVKNE